MKMLHLPMNMGNDDWYIHKSQYVHIMDNGDVYLLWKNDLPRLQSYDWSCDGTFRITKNSSFKQIYIISGIVRRNNSVYCFPLFCGLVKSKSKRNYQRMLQYIKQRYREAFPFPAEPLSPKTIISDFEPWGLTWILEDRNMTEEFSNYDIESFHTFVQYLFLSLLKAGFISAVEHCYPDSSISLCNTHLGNSVYRKLCSLAGVTTLEPGSKLDDLSYIWIGSSFLNINTSSGHDETITCHLKELAAQELNETKMELFNNYLNVYFNKTGIFRLQRY